MEASNFRCISAHIALTIRSENRNEQTNEWNGDISRKKQRKQWLKKSSAMQKTTKHTKWKRKIRNAFLSRCCDLIWTHCFALAEPSFWISITMLFALSEAHFFLLARADYSGIVMRLWRLPHAMILFFFLVGHFKF